MLLASQIQPQKNKTKKTPRFSKVINSVFSCMYIEVTFERIGYFQYLAVSSIGAAPPPPPPPVIRSGAEGISFMYELVYIQSEN